MKKFINTAFFYLIIGLCCGVLFRELTKYCNFDGTTALSGVHTHLLVLGAFLFLILTLFEQNFKISDEKNFEKFYIFYNIGLMLFTIMSLIRGVTQVLYTEVSNALNSSISGVAGIAHILIAIELIRLFIILKKRCDIIKN